ncbi:MAG: YceI family protein [Bacteroidota bacterium]
MKKILSIAISAAFAVSCRQKQINSSIYTVDETASKVEWKGSAPDHYHIGSFDVKGTLNTASSGTINGGDFIIPIASIKDFDLQDPVRQTLLDDLKSANFFNLLVHPQAQFHITSVKPYSAADTAAVAGANYMLTGDFSMIGQTHSISFPAKIERSEKGLSAEAKFNIDRTKWGMTIYSDPSKPLYILPEVNLTIKIEAKDSKLVTL